MVCWSISLSPTNLQTITLIYEDRRELVLIKIKFSSIFFTIRVRLPWTHLKASSSSRVFNIASAASSDPANAFISLSILLGMTPAEWATGESPTSDNAVTVEVHKESFVRNLIDHLTRLKLRLQWILLVSPEQFWGLPVESASTESVDFRSRRTAWQPLAAVVGPDGQHHPVLIQHKTCREE